MILVFGKTGQVATELQILAPTARFLDRAAADLADPAACARMIRQIKPRAVINAAAYTDVDKAEQEEAAAARINSAAPGAMAAACAALDIPFVHISTDYIFDGTGSRPCLPHDPAAPLGAYGRTKLAGENNVKKAGGRWAILRTSWVFSAHGNNFLKTMLRLSAQRETVSIVADQIGGPTPARDVAAACLEITSQLMNDREKTGTYHFAGTPDVSWAEFARVIIKAADLTCKVTDIPSSAYPTAAKRPANSRLGCDATSKAFGLRRPDWRRAVISIEKQLREHP